MSGRKSLFIFLMRLAWKCRFSMPLLLSGSAAVLGRAWMFQIRVHTVHQLRENEVRIAGLLRRGRGIGGRVGMGDGVHGLVGDHRRRSGLRVNDVIHSVG